MSDGAVTRAREWLAGKPRRGTDWMADEIIAELVALIDAAPVVDVFKYRGCIVIEPDDESLVGKRVRLLATEGE